MVLHMEALKDSDPMPFGKYKGTRLELVPDDYLLFVWNHPKFSQKSNPALYEYIKENLDAIQQNAKRK